LANRFDGKNSYTGGAVEDMLERMVEGYDGYVYFNNRFVDSEQVKMMECIVEGGHIEKGVLYRCNKGELLVPAIQ